MRCAFARNFLVAAGLLAAALSPVAAATAASGQPEPQWAERPDDQVYVFGLRLDRYVLTDGLIVFFDGQEVYAPLGVLAELLEFPIAVDPQAGTASGWFMSEDRTFDLDLSGPTLRLSGRDFDLDVDAMERHPDDIYVSTTELGRWFPIILEMRFSDLAINVIALEQLPLQERIAREDRQKHLRRGGDDENLERVDAADPWFDWPFVDTSIDLAGRRHIDDQGASARMTSTIVGVVGGLDGEATVITDSDQNVPNIRVRLGRQSLDGGLLGPLDAREFALGDVTTPDMPLVADNTVGRGFSISSFDVDRLEQTNRVTLRGELPVGWEVEVYRNGVLIDFLSDSDSDNGRYEFANLATLSGLNEFRLVFYGPQGQKRESVERYFVSPELSEPSRTDFRFAFNQRNKDLIDLDDTASNDPDDGENRLVFQLEHGINEALTIGGGFASLSVDGERRNYGTFQLQGSAFGALGEIDAAVDDSGGLALGGLLQTRIEGWSLTAEQGFFQDFHSEETDNSSLAGHLLSRTTVQANGHLLDLGFSRPTLSLGVEHDIAESDDWETSFFGRISTVIQPFNFSLSSNTQLQKDRETTSDARLLIGTLLGDFRLRGEVGVDVAPETAFDQVVLSADYRISENFGARVGLRHNGGENPVTGVNAGLNYQFEHFAIGFSVSGDDQGNYDGRLGLSFSLGRDPSDNSLAVRARPFARRGAVSAQVFLDRDNDGVFDADEEPLANAGFSGPRLPRGTRTDENGNAFIVGLEPYRDTRIGLDEATLEDPFLTSSRPPVRVVTRPGSATTLLFPVVPTGEIDGTVLVGEVDDAVLRPGAGLTVLLKDEAGQVVAEATSAFDGYFFFDRVPYGDYLLSLDVDQLERQGFMAGPSRPVAIDAEEPFALGQDLLAPLSPVITAADRNTTEQTD